MNHFPKLLSSQIGFDVAETLLEGFDRHYRVFRDAAIAAKGLFEAGDWHALHEILEAQSQIGAIATAYMLSLDQPGACGRHPGAVGMVPVPVGPFLQRLGRHIAILLGFVRQRRTRIRLEIVDRRAEGGAHGAQAVRYAYERGIA